MSEQTKTNAATVQKPLREHFKVTQIRSWSSVVNAMSKRHVIAITWRWHVVFLRQFVAYGPFCLMYIQNSRINTWGTVIFKLYLMTAGYLTRLCHGGLCPLQLPRMPRLLPSVAKEWLCRIESVSYIWHSWSWRYYAFLLFEIRQRRKENNKGRQNLLLSKHQQCLSSRRIPSTKMLVSNEDWKLVLAG